MEASLLPSKEVRGLAEKVVLAALKAENPACEELRKEFDIPWTNSWVVVLDSKGETLDCWVGDSAGAGCDEKTASQFPAMLVTKIEQSLARTTSLQALQREWDKSPNDTVAMDALLQRLAELSAFRKAIEVCEHRASDPSVSEEIRNLCRWRAFENKFNRDQDSDDPDQVKLAAEGEKLLADLAGHPQAEAFAESLFAFAYTRGFDVPAQCAAGLERLEKMARTHKDPGPLRKRIQQLTSILARWTEEIRQILAATEPNEQGFHAASLGDAKATIEFFSKPPLSDYPEYQKWVQQAKEKLERESKGK